MIWERNIIELYLFFSSIYCHLEARCEMKCNILTGFFLVVKISNQFVLVDDIAKLIFWNYLHYNKFMQYI